jgi:hypothetical protein
MVIVRLLVSLPLCAVALSCAGAPAGEAGPPPPRASELDDDHRPPGPADDLVLEQIDELEQVDDQDLKHVLEPAPATPARPATRPRPAAPAAADPSDPYACDAPADCVLSCPRAAGCCGWPCGCRHAIHRDHRDAFEAAYPKTCQKAPDCPAVACAHEPAVAATCRAGRCVGVTRLGDL